MLALIQHRLERTLEVARVIHRVEDTEDIDTAGRGTLDEGIHHVIGVMTIAEQVLGAQQHLLLSLGHRFLQGTNARPGVFAQVADAGVEGRAAPALQRPEADVVQLGGDRQHVIEAHARGQQ